MSPSRLSRQIRDRRQLSRLATLARTGQILVISEGSRALAPSRAKRRLRQVSTRIWTRSPAHEHVEHALDALVVAEDEHVVEDHGRRPTLAQEQLGVGEALRLFSKATELDPDFASAYGAAARCYVVWRMANGWMTDRVQEVAEATRLAARVVELGKDDAVALSFSGFALGYVVGEVGPGVELIDRALVLNPNLAAAWSASGALRIYRGDNDVAIEHLARALRLSPSIP